MQNLTKKSETNILNSSDNVKKRSSPKILFESVNNQSKTVKKSKLKKRERVIFGLIKDDFNCKIKIPNENFREISQTKKDSRRKKKESCFNTGRWQQDEHQRFIEALLKYGNDWKSVQKHVGSRSSTQARSHAQKFFVKIGKTQIENLQLDFENNSLKSLNIMANNLNNDQMARAIKCLNQMAFDKKNIGRKISRSSKSENSLNLSNSPFSKIINVYDLDSKDYMENCQEGFCFGDKINCQYSTSADVSASVVKNLSKRKRIRTMKRRKNSLNPYYKESVYANEDFKVKGLENTAFNSKKNLKQTICLSYSNRKNSFDYNYSNLVNENSYYLPNTNFRKNSFFLDDKEFLEIFQSSFKFMNCLNDQILEDNDARSIFLVEDSSPSQRRSSFEEMKDLNVIEEFMD